jgi:hypothetical protein
MIKKKINKMFKVSMLFAAWLIGGMIVQELIIPEIVYAESFKFNVNLSFNDESKQATITVPGNFSSKDEAIQVNSFKQRVIKFAENAFHHDGLLAISSINLSDDGHVIVFLYEPDQLCVNIFRKFDDDQLPALLRMDKFSNSKVKRSDFFRDVGTLGYEIGIALCKKIINNHIQQTKLQYLS